MRSPQRPSILLALLAPAASAQTWTTLDFREGSSEGGAPTRFVELDDGSVRADGDGDAASYRLEFRAELGGITALRLEALPDPSLPASGPGRAPDGNFILSELHLRSAVGASARSLSFSTASASFAQVGWPALAALDGRDDTGWAVGGGGIGKPQELVLNLDEPLGRGARTLVLELAFRPGQRAALGRLRLSATEATGRIVASGVDQGRMDLNAAIAESTARGVRWLLAQQELDGSWSDQQQEYPAGVTGLAVYALVKAGVDPDHQAIQRGLAYLAAHPPRKTYGAGCTLLAYSAAGDPKWNDHVERVLEDLLEWQVGDWGYPGSVGNPRDDHRDLSNTQYGTLGLWSAMKLGFDVPKAAWEKLAERALLYQDPGDGGFCYTAGGRGSTGSMTAAGITVLALCKPHVGGALANDIENAMDRGLQWLDKNYDPTRNPGHDAGTWLEYYLYGIERVGAFAQRERFNGQDWYVEGARAFQRSQNPEGWWDRDARRQATTCFGLMFLARASAPTSGPGAATGAQLYGKDDPGVAVNLRASGDTPLSVWLSSFGDEMLRRWTFDGEQDKGPRVVSVDYVTDGRVLLADSRDGGSDWSYATKDPGEGWTGTTVEAKRWKTGRSGFGRPDSPQLAVGTPWTSDRLWLRHEFDVDLATLVSPRLEVACSAAAPAGGGGPRSEVVKLYDEELTFPGYLTAGPGQVRQADGDAESGTKYLRVDGQQRFRESIPGWGFPLREKPEEGEFRYLRFAWRKRDGGVMVQLAIDGGWGRALRYYAGENTAKFEPARSVDKRMPANWEVVTVDLWQDLGGDGFLTGIALSPMDGGADFDALYLSRTRSGLGRATRQADAPLEWGAGAAGGAEDAGAEPLTAWLNGELLGVLDAETAGFETWLEGEPLLSVLKQGRNVLCVRVDNRDPGRAVDLSLRDARVLGSVKGDPGAPSVGQRYPIRVSFPRPGEYALRARVRVLDEATKEPQVVESDPLVVRVREALAPELLRYASDDVRNLIAGGLEAVSASSESPGGAAGACVDGHQNTHWMCASGDASPSLAVVLARPAKADRLLLSAIGPGRRAGATPARVEVILNGKGDRFVAEVPADPLQKTEIDLGKAQRVRSFQVRILGRTGQQLAPVGFAEVELVLGEGR